MTPAGDAPPKIRILAGERTPPDAAALERLETVAALPYVAGPVVALGDLHWKPGLEVPSSTATATEDDIVLSLSSPSMNCGMTLVKTSLVAEEIHDGANISRLMMALRDHIPRTRNAPVVTRDEALEFVMRGGRAAARRYGLDLAVIAGMEEGGSLFADWEVDRAAVLDALDEECLERGRTSFAYIGGGNHFLEIQIVDEIRDAAACDALGLAVGQVVVMYHTGSERLGHDLGRLYASRLKTSSNRRRRYFFRKIPLHLGRVRRPGDLARRLRYHFARRQFIPVPAESPEGRRMLLSLKAASNYGYANRVAVLELVRRAFFKATGRKESFEVIADLSHNVIGKETIAGRPLWIHRHNSVRLTPPSQWPEGSLYRRIGRPSMLPGTNRTSSYLLVGREGAAGTLNSADHGAGRTVERFEEQGLLTPRRDRRTMKFTYRSAIPESLVHLSDEGVDEIVALLAGADVAVPAARLRPIAVLKG
ncbi:MAG TPA: RtcB family protein [Verrucomicrobiae bacterium]|nr:RtcB family protein [Verrucomicrobiae bacterium]